MNGSLDEASPLGDPMPVGLDAPDQLPAERGAAVSSALERTEFIDPPAPRPAEPLPAAAPAAPEPPHRDRPPEAIPIGNAALAAQEAVPVTPLEMRIRRLEDALAQLQQQRAAELRAAEQRVTNALPARPVPVATPIPPHQAPTEKLWELGKRVLASPVRLAQALSTGPAALQGKPAWLPVEAVAEGRAMVRMFTDPRYRLSWTGRIAPPALLVLFLISWWWVPFTSFAVIGYWLNKAADLVVAFVLYKFLAHEARRYRETAPDLPPSLRL
jgi:hypothetical protein